MRLPHPSMAPIAVRASRALRPLALLTALAIAGATTSFMLALTPAQERLVRAEAAYEDARLAHSRQTSMLKTEEELKDLWQDLPVRKEFAALILAISELAQQDQVAIPGMTYTLQKVEDGLALKASMTFRAAGEYREIRRFIYRLETTGPYLLIESLDASRPAGGPQTPAGRVVINIRVVTFLRPDQAPLARIIHDGSWRPPLAFSQSKGYPAVAREGDPLLFSLQWVREEPRWREAYSKQYVDRLSGEPARLHATEAAGRLVVAANPRLQQKRS